MGSAAVIALEIVFAVIEFVIQITPWVEVHLR